MLIFFIHGVTVRNASYAKELQEAIAMALSQDEAHNCYWQHQDVLNAILELLAEPNSNFASAA